ncbi:MAG: TIGR02147 family protein [Fibrobacteraceae bacterium]|nr:TIGR02147 family protein [Fibrobacteraceae bacterium]
MESIFNFLDYRAYILQYYLFHKQKHKGFSWRLLSHRAGFTSPVFLKLVAEGKRNLGLESIDAVGTALDLHGSEHSFWHHLVLFNQVTSSIEKQEHYLALHAMTGDIKSLKLMRGIQTFYGYWYIPAIRELISLYPFRDDFRLLADSLNPPISENEARYAVSVLVRLGLIRENQDGSWKQVPKALRSGTPLDRSVLLAYHREMLRLAGESLFKFDKNKRFVSSLTIGVSKECYEEILAETKAFKNKVLQLVHGDSHSDTVMQFCMQMFPLGVVPKDHFLKKR